MHKQADAPSGSRSQEVISLANANFACIGIESDNHAPARSSDLVMLLVE